MIGRIIASQIIDSLLTQAAKSAPDEACGILFGTGDHIRSIQPTANIHPAPHAHFEIDPMALFAAHKAARAGGAQIVGYYHSHPVGPPEPSATDRLMAAGDGKVWAIIGQAEVKFWRDGPEGFEPLCYGVPKR